MSIATKLTRGSCGLGLLFLSIVGCGESGTEMAGGISAREKLRVIVRPDPVKFLPREAFPIEIDRKIASGLAEYLDRDLELIVVDDLPTMKKKLLAGDADLIASSLTVTPERENELGFSLPYLHVNEVLVLSDSLQARLAIDSVEDLDGVEVFVRPSSSYHSTLTELKSRVPGLLIREVPESMDSEDIVNGVARGKYLATTIDSHYWAAISGFYDELVAPIETATDRPIALAVGPGNDELRKTINEYLIFRALTGQREDVYIDDFNGLKKRKRLRMLTRNNAATYFLHRGTQLGFEYELINKFAEEHDLLLEIVIPPSHADLIPWLREGRGDVIAAAMTITPRRSELVRFSKSYLGVDQLVVTRIDDPAPPDTTTDLAGREIHIRESSAFFDTLRELDADLAGVEIVFAPEDMETEKILEEVESGVRDLTICDSHLLEIEQTYGRQLVGSMSLGETELGWAVRKDNAELATALDQFLTDNHRGLFYNMMVQRYFENPKYANLAQDAFRSDRSGRISPYDDLARLYADQVDLDWRLVVSMMYQESEFDPDRVSWAGARGLMQMMPRTAKEMGVVDLTEPDCSIRAGTLYLDWLLDRFEPTLPLETRLRFALASYNAGRGHVLDARRLARKQGLDPDIWNDNVELAMLMLQKPTYYQKARFGYCRGSETVRYVRSIEQRYKRYVDQVPDRAAFENFEGAKSELSLGSR